VTTLMSCHCRRHKHNALAGIPQPLAKIHVFKPDGKKAFIESADSRPSAAAYHQERACRLLNVIASFSLHVAITSIHRIARPQSIDTQGFEG
jgi:hypothetical protein